MRLVDIGSWSSPVARQYAVRELPTLWLYVDGRQVADDTDEVVRALDALR